MFQLFYDSIKGIPNICICKPILIFATMIVNHILAETMPLRVSVSIKSEVETSK